MKLEGVHEVRKSRSALPASGLVVILLMALACSDDSDSAGTRGDDLGQTADPRDAGDLPDGGGGDAQADLGDGEETPVVEISFESASVERVGGSVGDTFEQTQYRVSSTVKNRGSKSARMVECDYSARRMDGSPVFSGLLGEASEIVASGTREFDVLEVVRTPKGTSYNFSVVISCTAENEVDGNVANSSTTVESSF